MSEISILKVASFELMREKREKKIKNECLFLNEEELPKTAKDMLIENIKALLSFREAEVHGQVGEPSPLYFDTPLLWGIREKGRSKCFVVDFIDERSLLLCDSFKNDLTDEEFKEKVEDIAIKFKEGRYWPICLLIIGQFQLSGSSQNFLTILTTDLKLGEYFMYDPEEIARTPGTPIYERFLKKGLIFPHIINEKLNTEDKVKVYQQSQADYFYDFLHLRHPPNPREHFSKEYPVNSLQEFDQNLKTQDKEYLSYVPIRITIDHLRVEGVLYSDINEKIQFAKSSKTGNELVLIKGENIKVKIGDKELDIDFSKMKELKVG